MDWVDLLVVVVAVAVIVDIHRIKADLAKIDGKIDLIKDDILEIKSSIDSIEKDIIEINLAG